MVLCHITAPSRLKVLNISASQLQVKEKMESDVDRWFVAVAALMPPLYWYIAVKTELSQEAKILIYKSI